MKFNTVGELKEALQCLPSDSRLLCGVEVKLLQAHFVKGVFYCYHYGQNFGCCKNASQYKDHVLQDAVDIRE